MKKWFPCAILVVIGLIGCDTQKYSPVHQDCNTIMEASREFNRSGSKTNIFLTRVTFSDDDTAAIFSYASAPFFTPGPGDPAPGPLPAPTPDKKKEAVEFAIACCRKASPATRLQQCIVRFVDPDGKIVFEVKVLRSDWSGTVFAPK